MGVEVGVGFGVGIDEGRRCVSKCVEREQQERVEHTAKSAQSESTERGDRVRGARSESRKRVERGQRIRESEIVRGARANERVEQDHTARGGSKCVWRSESKECVEREQECGVGARGALIETLSSPKNNSCWIYQMRHALPNHPISSGIYCPHGAHSLGPSSLAPGEVMYFKYEGMK